MGVTAVLLTCSYKDNQEFLRVGYYVNVEYDNQEMNESPPQYPDISRLTRHILMEKPRVTKFQIDWDDMAQNAGFAMNENANPNAVLQGSTEGLLEKGT